MADGLALTFQVLDSSRNSAVGDVLACAYDCQDPQIRSQAINAIVKSGRGKGCLRIVETWHDLDSDLRQVILDKPRVMTAAIRESLKSNDRQVIENGLELAHLIVEPQLVPDLIRMAEDERSAMRPIAASALIAISKAMAHGAKASQDQARSYAQRNTIHSQVIECFEKSLERYGVHRCSEIVDAFLMIVDCTNHVLRTCLRSPKDPAMAAVMKILMESNREEIVERLLVKYLTLTDTPPTIVRVWSQRTDLAFIESFCSKVGRFPSEVIRRNLQRMKNIQWLTGSLGHLGELNENRQIGVVQILRFSTMNTNDVFRVIEYLLANSEADVRHRAAEQIKNIATPASDRLVLRYAQDNDPKVQTIMLGQLKERNLPGATTILMQALDSEHPQVQAAARRCFPDISIDRYLATFETKDEATQISTGELLLKIDEQAIPKIGEELENGTRNRRLRAIQVVETLGLLETLVESVASVLDEDDYFTRLQAVLALGRCRNSVARSALRDALMDESTKVRQAAEKALQGMARIPSNERHSANGNNVQENHQVDPSGQD